MKSPLLLVGSVIGYVLPKEGQKHYRVSCEGEGTGISINPNGGTELFRLNPDYKPEKVMTHRRLSDLSVGEPKIARSWVMFDEGKLMADEIMHLRAEITRLSKIEPNKEDLP